MRTLQVPQELGVELLIIDILPDAQEAVAGGTDSLRNCCQEQQQARDDEPHLEESPMQMVMDKKEE